MGRTTGNVLVIADTHIPFEHRNYLDFCIETKKRFKCSEIIHIGDIVDFHFLSRYDKDPDGFSPMNELKEAKAHLKAWYKAFPKCQVLLGNHEDRLKKAAMKYGLTMALFKDSVETVCSEVLEFPKGWEYKYQVYMYGVRFFHGMGYGGKYAHQAAAVENGRSIVMGHLHTNAGTMWSANEDKIIFGLAVGCGIDRKSYAFGYGRDFRRKPILGCGVVSNHGKYAQFVPMEMG